MAKKLLVKTPQTLDGVNPAYDDDNKQIFSETIVEATALKQFESLNASLPKQLRHTWTTIEDSDKAPEAKTTKNAGK